MHQSSLRLRPAVIMPEPMRRLYLESFPAEERRPLHLLEKLIAGPSSPVTLLLLDCDAHPSLPAGFMTLWRFDDRTAYIEHFATRPELRGSGLGAQAMSLLADIVGDALLVIEVERPDDGPMASRRIRFYERCGFSLHDGYTYIQPPYGRGLPPVEMRLMTRGGDDSRHIEEIAAMLKQAVYNTPEPCDC